MTLPFVCVAARHHDRVGQLLVSPSWRLDVFGVAFGRRDAPVALLSAGRAPSRFASRTRKPWEDFSPRSEVCTKFTTCGVSAAPLCSGRPSGSGTVIILRSIFQPTRICSPGKTFEMRPGSGKAGTRSSTTQVCAPLPLESLHGSHLRASNAENAPPWVGSQPWPTFPKNGAPTRSAVSKIRRQEAASAPTKPGLTAQTVGWLRVFLLASFLG